MARLHNIFGPPLGGYDGGREKSAAALCRKIALADDGGEIEIWGDGAQTRSYCYVADCVEGLRRLMGSAYPDPVNLGQARMVTISQLADLIENIAGKHLTRRFDLTAPQCVRGRCSDNTTIRQVLGWEPQVSLEDGFAATYAWIAERLRLQPTDLITA